MRKSSKSKTRCSKIVHDIEFGNIEPDFVLYREERNITVGKKITILLLGAGIIGFGIFLGILFGGGGWIATLPFAILGSVFIWSVLRLKPHFLEIVHQATSQVYISSIDTLIDYEFQNSAIINCKTIPVTEDSFIKYVILQGDNRVNHKYTLFTGKEKTTLRGEPHDRNDKFAKTYDIKITQ